jgi:hypothetical protein
LFILESFFPMLEKGSVRTTVCLRDSRLRKHGALAVVFAFVALCMPLIPFASAQTSPLSTAASQQVADVAGVGGSTDLLQIIGRIINIGLGFLGILFLGITLYAGYLWMTSDGKGAGVEEAQKRLKNGVIGLLIIASSFAISNFIMGLLEGAATGGGGSSVTGSRGGLSGLGFAGAAGALGGGVIDYHIPERDATGVPRNSSIVIAFKQAIDPASAIAGYSDTTSSTSHDLNIDAIKIHPTGQDAALASREVDARLTGDHTMLVLTPRNPIGSPLRNTDYTVDLLPGDTGLRLEGGGSIFSPAGARTLSSTSGYSWRFEVSTVIDNVPPKLVSVVPVNGSRYAPNVVVQMNFDKPLNPISASGLIREGSGLTNIEVQSRPSSTATTATAPNGEFTISNRFQTVEFVTNTPCGVNSCGRQVYCLPPDSDISVRVKAASLSDVPPRARIIDSGRGSQLYDGIVDLTGNSFDGNGDGTAQGAGTDDYRWRFATESAPNLTPPRITTILPVPRTGSIAVDTVPQANFDSELQASTVTTDSVVLKTNEPAELHDTYWWTTQMTPLRSDGAEAGVGDRIAGARVSLNHRLFMTATSTSEGMLSPEYDPFVNSGVQNIYQNCFNPASSAHCTGSPYCCDDVRSDTECAFPPVLRPLPIRP